jgi:hypothetical protein
MVSKAHLQCQVVAGLPLHHCLHLALTSTDDVLVLNRGAAVAGGRGRSGSRAGGQGGSSSGSMFSTMAGVRVVNL